MELKPVATDLIGEPEYLEQWQQVGWLKECARVWSRREQKGRRISHCDGRPALGRRCFLHERVSLAR